MAVKGSKLLQMSENGRKWLEMALTMKMKNMMMIMMENQVGWPYDSFDCLLVALQIVVVSPLFLDFYLLEFGTDFLTTSDENLNELLFRLLVRAKVFFKDGIREVW